MCSNSLLVVLVLALHYWCLLLHVAAQRRHRVGHRIHATGCGHYMGLMVVWVPVFTSIIRSVNAHSLWSHQTHALLVTLLVEVTLIWLGLRSRMVIQSQLLPCSHVRWYLGRVDLRVVVWIHIWYCVSHSSGIQVLLQVDLLLLLLIELLLQLSSNYSGTGSRKLNEIFLELAHILSKCHLWVHRALTLMHMLCLELVRSLVARPSCIFLRYAVVQFLK